MFNDRDASSSGANYCLIRHSLSVLRVKWLTPERICDQWNRSTTALKKFLSFVTTNPFWPPWSQSVP